MPTRPASTMIGGSDAAISVGAMGRKSPGLPIAVVEESLHVGPTRAQSDRQLLTNGRTFPQKLWLLGAVATVLLLVLSVIVYINTNQAAVTIELSKGSRPSAGSASSPSAHPPPVADRDPRAHSTPVASSAGPASSPSAPRPPVADHGPRPLATPVATTPVPVSIPVPVTFTARAIDSNRGIKATKLLDPGWQVAYKAKAPTLDCRIAADEYGPALAIDVTDAIPLGHVYCGATRDFFAGMWTAFTSTDPFIAS